MARGMLCRNCVCSSRPLSARILRHAAGTHGIRRAAGAVIGGIAAQALRALRGRLVCLIAHDDLAARGRLGVLELQHGEVGLHRGRHEEKGHREHQVQAHGGQIACAVAGEELRRQVPGLKEERPERAPQPRVCVRQVLGGQLRELPQRVQRRLEPLAAGAAVALAHRVAAVLAAHRRWRAAGAGGSEAARAPAGAGVAGAMGGAGATGGAAAFMRRARWTSQPAAPGCRAPAARSHRR